MIKSFRSMLHKVLRVIFRSIIAHPDNIRLAIQGPLIHKFLPKKGKTVLDLGCGTGRYTERLTQRANQTVGLDVEMEILFKLKKRNINVSLVCASAEYRLPFRDSIFDFILCTEVVEHLQNDGSAVKEMRRVLKENGGLLISVPMPPPVYHDSAHKRDGYTLNKLETLLEKNGFEITDVNYCMLVISRLMLRFVSRYVKLLKFLPPVLPLVYLEKMIFFVCDKHKCKPFDLVVKARKLGNRGKPHLGTGGPFQDRVRCKIEIEERT